MLTLKNIFTANTNKDGQESEQKIINLFLQKTLNIKAEIKAVAVNRHN